MRAMLSADDLTDIERRRLRLTDGRIGLLCDHFAPRSDTQRLAAHVSLLADDVDALRTADVW